MELRIKGRGIGCCVAGEEVSVAGNRDHVGVIHVCAARVCHLSLQKNEMWLIYPQDLDQASNSEHVFSSWLCNSRCAFLNNPG